MDHERQARRLVLLFDGTGKTFAEEKQTNVAKLYDILMDNSNEQLCHYEPGVGVYYKNTMGPVRSALRWGDQILNQVDAADLDYHVRNGYKFLMQHYHPGDKIYLFGFSRGAYIARILAGWLHKMGLLYDRKIVSIDEAYDLYLSTDNLNEVQVRLFRLKSCQSVQVQFMGLWDTVASVGLLRRPSLPYVDTNPSIRVFRQALSLDEHRVRFLPELYYHGDLDGSPSRPVVLGFDPTNAADVWFAGCHSDIGGGNAPPNPRARALSNITLRWMVQEVLHLEQGLRLSFDHDTIARLNLHVGIGQVLPLNEVLEWDGKDAVGPITDELSKNPCWWVLEIIPVLYFSWWPHLGRSRRLPPEYSIHGSVYTRINDPEIGYKPRALTVD